MTTSNTRLVLAVLACLALGASGPALAIGTPAGTPVTNVATANYNIGGVAATAVSGDVTFTVDEIVDVTLTQQGQRSVVDGESGAPVAFLITNVGNGSEEFIPTAAAVAVGPPPDFLPAVVEIRVDNGDGIFVAADDPVYNGTNLPALDANGTDSAIVFVISNIPGGVNDLDIGQVTLTATSDTRQNGTVTSGTGKDPGSVFGNQGDTGVNLVLGTTAGQAVDTGTYVVSDVTVTVDKTITAVDDQLGGSSFVPGAVVSYRITVTVAGSGTAEALTISDPIPAETTLDPNSIFVDTIGPKTIAADGDEVVFTGGTLTVTFGDTTASTHNIDFDVTVN